MIVFEIIERVNRGETITLPREAVWILIEECTRHHVNCDVQIEIDNEIDNEVARLKVTRPQHPQQGRNRA